MRVGTWGYLAGVSGTATVPKGATLAQVVAFGAGTVSIFGGTAIPIPAAGITLRFPHELAQATSSQDLVFSGTTGYFVEFVKAGNT